MRSRGSPSPFWTAAYRWVGKPLSTQGTAELYQIAYLVRRRASVLFDLAGGRAGLALDGRAVKRHDQVSPRPPTQMAKGERGPTCVFFPGFLTQMAKLDWLACRRRVACIQLLSSLHAAPSQTPLTDCSWPNPSWKAFPGQRGPRLGPIP